MYFVQHNLVIQMGKNMPFLYDRKDKVKLSLCLPN
jgi:hypothetical protein